MLWFDWTTYPLRKEPSKIELSIVRKMFNSNHSVLTSCFLKIVFKTFVILTVVLKVITKCLFQNNFSKLHYLQSVLTEIVFAPNLCMWGVEHEPAINSPCLGALFSKARGAQTVMHLFPCRWMGVDPTPGCHTALWTAQEKCCINWRHFSSLWSSQPGFSYNSCFS